MQTTHESTLRRDCFQFKNRSFAHFRHTTGGANDPLLSPQGAPLLVPPPSPPISIYYIIIPNPRRHLHVTHHIISHHHTILHTNQPTKPTTPPPPPPLYSYLLLHHSILPLFSRTHLHPTPHSHTSHPPISHKENISSFSATQLSPCPPLHKFPTLHRLLPSLNRLRKLFLSTTPSQNSTQFQWLTYLPSPTSNSSSFTIVSIIEKSCIVLASIPHHLTVVLLRLLFITLLLSSPTWMS